MNLRILIKINTKEEIDKHVDFVLILIISTYVLCNLWDDWSHCLSFRKLNKTPSIGVYAGTLVISLFMRGSTDFFNFKDRL